MVPDLWQPDEEILSVIAGKYDDPGQVKAALEGGLYNIFGWCLQ